jgi:hypothetical protein
VSPETLVQDRVGIVSVIIKHEAKLGGEGVRRGVFLPNMGGEMSSGKNFWRGNDQGELSEGNVWESFSYDPIHIQASS